MNSKHLIAWILVVGTVIWVGSCKPKNSDEVKPEPEDSTVIIARSCILSEERIDGALFRALEYDSTHRLVRVYEYSADITLNRLLKRYTVEYDPKDSTKIVRLRETNLAERDKSFIFEIDYNDDGTYKYIRPFQIYNSGPRPIDTISVFYDDNKRVNEMKAASLFHYVWDYDSAGNVQKWSIRRPEQATDSLLVEYKEYDDKINHNLSSKALQLINLLKGGPVSRHNPKLYNLLGATDVSIDYEYNSKNLPTQAIYRYRNIGDTLSVVQTHRLVLDCK